ncbi:hypothetical protein QU487_02055 [Crenobacter sp. SG2305]|uniref:hypothetical protein n=1 Tax=Crenobacter oryzisoli TaxID=3056844 RepID=UPI0025AB525F|nr:hypothetical protein [Crenobacter sp. SG2305]MDN0081543.1 hypothetical protein [Crenobacter sp. SG2305]
MKRSLQYSLIFSALVGIYGIAHAGTTLDLDNHIKVDNDPSYNFRDTSRTKLESDLTVDVDVKFDKRIRTDEGTVAVARDTQKLLPGAEADNPVYFEDPAHASVSNSVQRNSGNTGVNVAAGAWNQQANEAAIATNSTRHRNRWDDDVVSAADAGFEQNIGDVYMHLGHGNNATATLSRDSVTHNAGNTAVNVAAGIGNQQKNVLALANHDNDNHQPVELLNANASSAQLMLDTNLGTRWGWGDIDFHSAVYDSIERNSGNIGVNVGAGAFNQQGNALAVATADSAELSSATAGGIQVIADARLDIDRALDTRATVRDSVNHNSGNIGVNVASGIGNQQANLLAIAAPK